MYLTKLYQHNLNDDDELHNTDAHMHALFQPVYTFHHSGERVATIRSRTPMFTPRGAHGIEISLFPTAGYFVINSCRGI